MFKKLVVPTRSFYCELKHRPPDDCTGEQEELIDILILEIPKLKNSNLEKQWAIADIWNKLESAEFIEKRINQVFIFTAVTSKNKEPEPGDLIIRLEANKFEDEPAEKLKAPLPTNFQTWQQKVDSQFKNIYGFSVKQWQENS